MVYQEKFKLYTLDNKLIEETSDKRKLNNHTGFVRDRNSKWCMKNGVLHSLNGPAYEYFDGDREKYFYIDGKQLENATEESFKLYINLLKLKGMLT